MTRKNQRKYGQEGARDSSRDVQGSGDVGRRAGEQRDGG